ncbi:MAG: putative zinc-binding peptidase [Thiohalocapsa sp.]
MKTFSCGVCHKPVYFENTVCTHCGTTLGFLPDNMRLAALVEGEDGLWREPRGGPDASVGHGASRDGTAVGDCHLEPMPAGLATVAARRTPQAYRKCGNYALHDVCNWMVPADGGDTNCAVCRLNQIIPNLASPGNLDKWFRIERGKRRLAYGLLRLGLPVRSKAEDPRGGLGFALLSSQDAPPGEPVVTGHANGLITLNTDEADPSIRERIRLDMDEKYRTLLGHFRHEIGHYYWDLLIRDGRRLEDFRLQFGDERVDYGQALDAHYATGAPADWQDSYISTYASSHPWEDWAETWAHYLHIVDTLETGEHFGIAVERRMPDGSVQRSDPDFDPYAIGDFEPIIEHWLPLTFALNSINRSMGQTDLYPFVLSQPVIDKLGFVHSVVRDTGRGGL